MKVEGSYLEGIRQNSIIVIVGKLKQKIPCSLFVVPSLSEIRARFIGKTERFYSVHRGIMVADESIGNKSTRIVNRLLWLWEMRSAQQIRLGG
ncbi:hypothetical protein [Microcoleus sp. B9-D4]|uniref:hypothetical protein n=1 Tax=Microcoleus sp. B9-D4 TaxID=2818711 RepID=UPI002FD40381